MFAFRLLNLENVGPISRTYTYPKVSTMPVLPNSYPFTVGLMSYTMLDISLKQRLLIIYIASTRLRFGLVKFFKISSLTGQSRRLLDPLLRYIRYIDSVFGLREGQKAGQVLSQVHLKLINCCNPLIGILVTRNLSWHCSKDTSRLVINLCLYWRTIFSKNEVSQGLKDIILMWRPKLVVKHPIRVLHQRALQSIPIIKLIDVCGT